MFAQRAFRLLVSLLGVAACLRCGAGVSVDPLERRPSSSVSNLKGAGTTCKSRTECASDVCLPDIDGTARCCKTDCVALGRVCSSEGECICGRDAQEVEGRCRFVDGQRCQDGKECANGHCADGVCCDAP